MYFLYWNRKALIPCSKGEEYNGKGMTSAWRYILHADLDAFYASVEQRDNPTLKGKPLVVGGAPEHRGVVAAASYEARKYGIHSAMPMRTAMTRYADLVRVSPRFPKYRDVSRQIMEILRSLTPMVESLSLDEAYLDISQAMAVDMIEVERTARHLKAMVRVETQLAMTIGGGTSKTVAKIASQAAKPDGLLMVQPGDEQGFLGPLDVSMLWGIGPKTTITLEKYGIRTIGDLAARDENWLESALGKRGPELKASALGLDDRQVTPYHETKSVSAETTLTTDVEDEAALTQELATLTRQVAERLDRAELQGKTISIKLRLADFTTFTRQTTLPSPVSDEASIYEVARTLLSRETEPGRWFRLIGVGISNFQEASQLALLLRRPLEPEASEG